jgi:hypothetical protein
MASIPGALLGICQIAADRRPPLLAAPTLQAHDQGLISQRTVSSRQEGIPACVFVCALLPAGIPLRIPSAFASTLA